MVYLRIAVLKQTLNRNGGERIRTAPVLLLPEQVFQQILTRGLGLAELFYLLHHTLVPRTVFFHALFKLVALVKIPGHLAGKLNIDKGRTAAALTDDSVDHLYGLGDCAADNGACDRFKVFFRQMEITRPFNIAVSLEIIARRRTGLVIFHSLLKPRN